MPYDSLEKSYYSNREHYEQDYLERFHGRTTVHIDFDILGSPAFYLPTNEMLSLDYRISRLDKAVTRIRSALPSAAVSQYYYKSLIDEVHLSLDIEHIYSTKKEIAEIYRSQKKDRLLGMINKYSALLKGDAVSLKTGGDVRALYDEICLPEVISEDPTNAPDGDIFRKKKVFVAKGEKEIHTGLYPEAKIISAVENALRFLNDDNVPILIRVAVFHYMLGYIHPFYDGNGRLARFISSYSLSKEMDPLIAVRLSYTIKEQRNTYYKMFATTNNQKNKGDLTGFIIGFLGILETSYKNLHEALSEKETQLNTFRDLLNRVIVSDKKLNEVAYLLLQVSLFNPSGLRMTEICDILSGVGARSVRRYLTSSDSAHMFVCTKEGKAKHYSLNVEWLLSVGNP